MKIAIAVIIGLALGLTACAFFWVLFFGHPQSVPAKHWQPPTYYVRGVKI